LLTSAQTGKRWTLKVGRTPPTIAELEQENRVLDALAPWRPFVARPVASVVRDGHGWFLFTCLEGTNIAHALWQPGSTPEQRHRLGRRLRSNVARHSRHVDP
jgi:hypothetical protein